MKNLILESPFDFDAVKNMANRTRVYNIEIATLETFFHDNAKHRITCYFKVTLELSQKKSQFCKVCWS